MPRRSGRGRPLIGRHLSAVVGPLVRRTIASILSIIIMPPPSKVPRRKDSQAWVVFMQRAPSHYQPILQDISTYPTLRRRPRRLLLLTLGETGESFRFQGGRGEKRQARGLETNSGDGPYQLAAWVLSFMPAQPCLITAAVRASMEQVHADRAGGWAPHHIPHDLRGGARDLSALMTRRQNPYCMAWHKLGILGIPRIWGGNLCIHTLPRPLLDDSSQTWNG